MTQKKLLTELVDGLCKIFGDSLSEIVLYGSVARREATDESDIDIAVIINEPLSPDKREKFIELSSRLDSKYEKVLSIVDVERNNLEKWGRLLPFYKNIREEGIVLWKAA